MSCVSNYLFCTSDLTLEMIPNEETFNMKDVRLVKMVKIAFGLVSIRGPLPPQKRPAKCSKFKLNSFGKFG